MKILPHLKKKTVIYYHHVIASGGRLHFSKMVIATSSTLRKVSFPCPHEEVKPQSPPLDSGPALVTHGTVGCESKDAAWLWRWSQEGLLTSARSSCGVSASEAPSQVVPLRIQPHDGPHGRVQSTFPGESEHSSLSSWGSRCRGAEKTSPLCPV